MWSVWCFVSCPTCAGCAQGILNLSTFQILTTFLYLLHVYRYTGFILLVGTGKGKPYRIQQPASIPSHMTREYPHSQALPV
jgi:hypothetical protein